MRDNANHKRLTLSSAVYVLMRAARSRLSTLPLLLVALGFLGSLSISPLACGQDQDEIKGAPAEPSDAQEVRAQIAAV